MKRILFVCVRNSGRSQMAEAFLNRLGKDRVLAESAGTIPSGQINPLVRAVMQEKDIDLSSHTPKLLTPEMIQRADRIITMGCSIEEACPTGFVPAEDWGLEDPEGKSLEEVKWIRDQVEAKVNALLKELTERA